VTSAAIRYLFGIAFFVVSGCSAIELPSVSKLTAVVTYGDARASGGDRYFDVQLTNTNSRALCFPLGAFDASTFDVQGMDGRITAKSSASDTFGGSVLPMYVVGPGKVLHLTARLGSTFLLEQNVEYEASLATFAVLCSSIQSVEPAQWNSVELRIPVESTRIRFRG
jgi:hypothetical protein